MNQTLSYTNHFGYDDEMIKPEKPRPPRRNADYRWTTPKAIAFMRVLGATGSVAAAARRVGMSRQSAYRLRARLGSDFAQLWDDGVRLVRLYGPRPEPAAGSPAATGPNSQGDTLGPK